MLQSLLMHVLKARVKNGRIVLEEPDTELPEGTELSLVLEPGHQEMDEEELARLNLALERGLAQAESGQGIDADELHKRLRSSATK